jgi:hypothetical protein
MSLDRVDLVVTQTLINSTSQRQYLFGVFDRFHHETNLLTLRELEVGRGNKAEPAMLIYGFERFSLHQIAPSFRDSSARQWT